MNPTWTDAQNWLDILDHVWIGLVVVGAAAIPSWLAARNHRSIKDIKDQVVNGHAKEPDAPKLRDDIDQMKFAMERWEPVLKSVPQLMHFVTKLSGQLSDMSERVLAEEEQRRLQISELRKELDHQTGKRRHITE